MIRNKREYRLTAALADKFRNSIEAAETDPPPSGVAPKVHQASIDAMAVQLEMLTDELRAYDDFELSGRKRLRGQFRDLGPALIQARIARGWTPRELAKRLRLDEQRVVTYETSEYRTASLTTVGNVLQTLGAAVHLRVELANLALREAAPSVKR